MVCLAVGRSFNVALRGSWPLEGYHALPLRSYKRERAQQAASVPQLLRARPPSPTLFRCGNPAVRGPPFGFSKVLCSCLNNGLVTSLNPLGHRQSYTVIRVLTTYGQRLGPLRKHNRRPMSHLRPRYDVASPSGQHLSGFLAW